MPLSTTYPEAHTIALVTKREGQQGLQRRAATEAHEAMKALDGSLAGLSKRDTAWSHLSQAIRWLDALDETYARTE